MHLAEQDDYEVPTKQAMLEPQYLALIAAIPLTVVALVWDLRTRRIPNWLTVSAFAAALVFHTVAGALAAGWSGAWAGLGTSLAGFGAGFGLLLILWLVGGGGGGDVKLMGALGAWIGARLILVVFLGSAVVAFVMLIGVFTWQAVSRAGQPAYAGAGGRARGGDAKQQMHSARRVIPYAFPAAVATWALVGLKLFAAWHG